MSKKPAVLEALPQAKKMLIIIGNRLCRKVESIKEDMDLQKDLGLSETEKEELLLCIAERFFIPVHDRHLNIIVEGKYEKDTFKGHLQKRIKTVYDIQKFIEGNDDINGKAAAYNLQ